MLGIFHRIFGDRDDDAGSRAERLAADWLTQHRGFEVIARNWRNPRDRREELDLVCRDGDVLVFVEVKARSASAMVPGYFAVDRRKKRVLLSAAKAYLARLRPKPAAFRCDVVEIELPIGGSASQPQQGLDSPPVAPAVPVIRHFGNVPLFPKHYRG